MLVDGLGNKRQWILCIYQRVSFPYISFYEPIQEFNSNTAGLW
ncbi:Hypothetical protein CpCap5W_1486 [Corynebacterium pseudotuberculosis]|nr:Hypothetical protein Cp3995_1220 [Corynebacterium pseudotuberculosis 3/99-5]AFH52147.1 Hypothetical protein Cp267_1248 [Corynebacterium pseudotuberculosis 267]AIG07598.1 hypothetical protein CPTA_01769 [Corynebacterium pseudotuberculosis]AIG10050.1 hypothetical protein CPTB_01994 [Corynebacterium pseudotuberculosis]AIG12048.1 hypothetical protein CPTC_01760 [Corynebacterium pseudotuberculosis]